MVIPVAGETPDVENPTPKAFVMGDPNGADGRLSGF
jgi:hypothetical protein